MIINKFDVGEIVHIVDNNSGTDYVIVRIRFENTSTGEVLYDIESMDGDVGYDHIEEDELYSPLTTPPTDAYDRAMRGI